MTKFFISPGDPAGIGPEITLKALSENKIIALGGISKKNIKKLKLLDVSGFAGISYFE